MPQPSDAPGPSAAGGGEPGRAPFEDPRVVAFYDEDNPAGPDHDFYRRLADGLDARTVVDLGCGTGMLTVTLGRPGRRVVGIDPSAAMLAVARSRPGGDGIEWRRGDSRRLRGLTADLVVMTGNVAQHLLGAVWTDSLREVHEALEPGGVLAFESRNPSVGAWEGWVERRTRSTRDTGNGPLTRWLQVVDVGPEEVTFETHHVFERTGEHLVHVSTLAFRTAAQLGHDLSVAGLTVETVEGGWEHEPLTPTSRLIVVTARRSPSRPCR